ncbi:MAG TPA: hypothetical protein VJ984_13655 [Xanthomonadales bacterium]|nr:hypothetical protein [Xanthomonadales bacterium]
MEQVELKGQLDMLVGQPATKFTLHRDEMLLVDQISRIDSRSATCTWTVPEFHPLFTLDGQIPAYVGIECMAQCIAVHAGALESLKGKGPPLGLLLGTRHFEASCDHLEKGIELQISCLEIIRDAQGLASFECEIKQEDLIVASCKLTVFQVK